MKRTFFRPGVFSLFMLALMIYLSCNKHNNTEVIPHQNISASGNNEPLNVLKRLKEPVMQSNDKSANYTGNIWIKNYQDKGNILIYKRLGPDKNAFHTYNIDGTDAAILDIAFLKNLSKNYTTFTVIKSTLN